MNISKFNESKFHDNDSNKPIKCHIFSVSFEIKNKKNFQIRNQKNNKIIDSKKK